MFMQGKVNLAKITMLESHHPLLEVLGIKSALN